MTTPDNHALLQRVQALPQNQYASYTTMSCTDDITSPYASFTLSKTEMEKILELAAVGMKAGAADITLYWPAHWSDPELRTDIDRLEISLARKIEHCSVQLRALLQDDHYITSPCVQLDELVTKLENASKEGKDTIWFSGPGDDEECEIEAAVEAMQRRSDNRLNTARPGE